MLCANMVDPKSENGLQIESFFFCRFVRALTECISVTGVGQVSHLFFAWFGGRVALQCPWLGVHEGQLRFFLQRLLEHVAVKIAVDRCYAFFSRPLALLLSTFVALGGCDTGCVSYLARIPYRLNLQVIINFNALPWLLNLLSSSKKGIRKEACWTISNITAGNKEQIQAVIEANIIPPLIQLLSNAEFDIRKVRQRARLLQDHFQS